MEIMVHSKKSVATKVSKEIVPFQQEFPNLRVWCKNDPIGHLESESDKKICFWLPVLLGIWLYPETSNSLRLCNPGTYLTMPNKPPSTYYFEFISVSSATAFRT